MEKSIKDTIAQMLAKWLFKDFGLLIDEPSEEDIKRNLEEYDV